jgi:hypothetical protein
VAKWIEHFRRNRLNRPEPEWDQPIVMSPAIQRKLIPSLEQFQLGDGGGPASLIARDAERFRGSSEEMRQLVDEWFREEREHSRLLGAAVQRFGGRRIDSHWSFTAFCTCRRLLGVRFELQVLLLTEIVSTAYYRVLRRHVPDAPVKQMCSLILRDEAGHVAFHLDRLSHERRDRAWIGTSRWRTQFCACGFAAGTMLWVNHGPALKPLGATTFEFYREIGVEITRFLRRFHRRARAEAFSAAKNSSGKMTFPKIIPAG